MIRGVCDWTLALLSAHTHYCPRWMDGGNVRPQSATEALIATMTTTGMVVCGYGIAGSWMRHAVPARYQRHWMILPVCFRKKAHRLLRLCRRLLLRRSCLRAGSCQNAPFWNDRYHSRRRLHHHHHHTSVCTRHSDISVLPYP